MEAKLKEYRALRRRNQLIEEAKEKLNETKEKLEDFLTPKVFTDMGNENDEEVLLMHDEAPPPIDDTPLLHQTESDIASEISDIESIEGAHHESWQPCMIKWIFFAIIWLAFFLYFLKIQFGAVYFVITVLIGIYLNTRTRPKQEGEVSAYNVFNENCKSIDGTINVEQFEREIRFGPGTVVRPF
ncbi:hypothetical protein K1T71_010671 [Dendrolimus kikuchii]|uniref:Uncharacterized protein n=1 Tax=Dendrolimus kikuchii TaxID=765133 RepID=A0ACC1CPU8_9NEOP|nr:hypothetical protein K1T71_010671 [Dendrolimus kikuchii]